MITLYRAYITRIQNLRKHTNADRLQCGECFGNTVIVDLSTQPEELGLYFPTDGKLGLEYATKNNLLRRKDADGNNVGGYLDPVKRNIRAMKLRGEKSDGLFMPLKSLESFTDISKLKEGDTITVLNGVTICEKYIPKVQTPKQHGGGNRVRKHKEPIAPLFAEHADTEQLAYNLSAFHPGDLIEITLKMHGCFTGDTRVRMANGKQKRIREINVGEQVLAYNFETRSFEAATVKTVFHNDKSSEWRKIKMSRDYMRGDKRGFIFCTPNHPFWSDDLGCWVEAKDLRVGDTLQSAFPSMILSQAQKDIAIGNFLGDGCYLEYGDIKTAEMQTSAKIDHEDYIDYLISATGGWYQKVSQTYTSGYGTKMVRARTERCADLADYFSDVFQKDGKQKRLLRGIIDKFSALSMAIFYLDDGSIINYKNKQGASFAVCDFDEESTDIICECLRKFGLETTPYKDPGGYMRIRVLADSADRMFRMISRYVPESMKYKLPEKYRTVTCVLPENREGHNGYVMRPQTVKANDPVTAKRGWVEYDLETSLHNYIVGCQIVHNTSQRTAYLPVFSGYKRSFKDWLLRRPGKPIYEYGYVTGTRRTVLDDFADGGYYGNNSFREPHAEAFEGKLHKGETVYYEVVGFTDNGKPIMPSCPNKKVNDKEFTKQYGETTTFSYGCDPTGSITIDASGLLDGGFPNAEKAVSVQKEVPVHDCYVYRMTMTNEDGDVVEYTPDFMRYRCQQMGVKCVPVFYCGFVPSETAVATAGYRDVPEWVKDRAERYYDGPDPIGKTHVREGVVARIVNRPSFTAFKDKNIFFKILEGIYKEDAAAPDIEEAEELEDAADEET